MSNVAPFANTSPACDGVAVTPSDSTVYDPPLRAIYVGVTGNLAITTTGGTVLTIANAAVGYHPWQATKVMTTNTTATSILGIR